MSYGGDGQTKKIILHMELEKCIVGGDEECNSLHLGISSIEVSRIQSFPLADCDSRNVEMSGQGISSGKNNWLLFANKNVHCMSVTTLPLVLIVFTSMLIICRLAKPNIPLTCQITRAQTIIVTTFSQKRHSSIAPRSPHHISLPTTIHILYTLNCLNIIKINTNIIIISITGHGLINSSFINTCRFW